MKRKYILIAIVWLLIVTVGFGADEIQVESDNPTFTAEQSQEQRYRDIKNQIRLFGEVYRRVNARYVDEIDPEEFIRAGIRGMLETLDPYTVLFEPEQVDDLEVMTRGEYGGVGIEIGLRGSDRELTVIAPIDDTPASRKGIRAGDVIIAVNGQSTAGFTTSDASELIRGPAGTDVILTIRRAGYDEPLDYTLTREIIRIHDVAYSGIIDGDIGYVKLVRFSGQAGEELHNALQEMMNADPNEVPSGLILDLRSNPGGLLPSAVRVASEFLHQGDLVVETHGRTVRSERELTVTGEPTADDIPLVVLINGGSASASEIVSGAIQDLDRGVIIGTQSFGKGLVQTVVNLPGESMMKITTARYYTPSGRLIQRDRHRGDDDVEEVNQVIMTPDSILHPAGIEDEPRRYFTRNGREMFGGGGINPDVVIEQPLMNLAIVEMYRRGLFFSFIQKWINEHGEPDSVEITDEMLTQFNSFLDSSEFSPPIQGSRELDALREIGTEDSLGEQYFAQLELLESFLMRQNQLHEPDVRESIRQNLERELASALGGREWRIRATFDEDVQLSEAIRILRDPERYRTLLQPDPDNPITADENR